MGRRTDSRWNLSKEAIISAMLSISMDVNVWLTEKSFIDGTCWFSLAAVLFKEPQKRDLLWLRLIFVENRRQLQANFCTLVRLGDEMEFAPRLCSTRGSAGDRYCICQKKFSDSDPEMVECISCENWYHAICIREDIAKVAKNPKYTCPVCLENSYIYFPSVWQYNCKSSEAMQVSFVSDIERSDLMLDVNSPLVRHTIVSAVHASAEMAPTVDFESCAPNYTARTFCSGVNIDVNNAESISPPISALNSALLIPSTTQGCAAVESKPKINIHDDAYWEAKNYAVDSVGKPEEEPLSCVSPPSQSQYSPNCSDVEYVDANYTVIEDYICAESPPLSFTFSFPLTDWESLVHVDGDTRRLLPGWGDVLRDYMKLFNPLCVFNFKRHHLLKGRLGPIFTGYGRCNHVDCVTFTVSGCKQADDNVKFAVQCQGKFAHRKGDVHRNRVQCQKRAGMRKKLTHQKAAAFTTEYNKDANMIAVRAGNHSSVLKKKTVRTIRSEQLKSKDLHQDPLMDLLYSIRLEGDRTFVRHLAWLPFSVVYFLDRQLEILQLMLRNKLQVILHVDATSTVVHKLPKDVGEAAVFMYAIVISNPLPGSSPLALCEFMTNDQRTPSISQGIGAFKNSATTYLRMPSCKSICTRVETDFSLAMIGAVIQNFWPRMSIRMYLNACWSELFDEGPVSPVNLHVCRSHMMKTFTDKLKKCYPTDGSCVAVIQGLLRLYVLAESMDEVAYYVNKLLTLCSTPECTEAVDMAVSTLQHIPPQTPDVSYDWTEFVQHQLSDKEIYKSTSFGMFFEGMLDRISDEDHSDTTKLSHNIYYSPKFTNYLKVHILPYTPLLTHVMFPIRKDSGVMDTQTAVEKWHDIVKHDEQCKDGKLKIPRYVAAAKEIMEGRCNAFEADLLEFLGKSKAQCNKRSTGKYGSNNKKLCRPTEEDEDFNHHEASVPIKSYLHEEQWKRKGQKVAHPTFSIDVFRSLPFVPWSHFADDKCGYSFRNTCTLDNTFQILTFLYNRVDVVRTFLSQNNLPATETIVQCINFIRDKKVNHARRFWLHSLTNVKISCEPHINDLFGDEYAFSNVALDKVLECYVEKGECDDHGVVWEKYISLSAMQQQNYKFAGWDYNNRQPLSTPVNPEVHFLRTSEDIVPVCVPKYTKPFENKLCRLGEWRKATLKTYGDEFRKQYGELVQVEDTSTVFFVNFFFFERRRKHVHSNLFPGKVATPFQRFRPGMSCLGRGAHGRTVCIIPQKKASESFKLWWGETAVPYYKRIRSGNPSLPFGITRRRCLVRPLIRFESAGFMRIRAKCTTNDQPAPVKIKSLLSVETGIRPSQSRKCLNCNAFGHIRKNCIRFTNYTK